MIKQDVQIGEWDRRMLQVLELVCAKQKCSGFEGRA